LDVETLMTVFEGPGAFEANTGEIGLEGWREAVTGGLGLEPEFDPVAAEGGFEGEIDAVSVEPGLASVSLFSAADLAAFSAAPGLGTVFGRKNSGSISIIGGGAAVSSRAVSCFADAAGVPEACAGSG
jgi:hypothetical protein